MFRDDLLADLRALCEETLGYIDGIDEEAFVADKGRQRMVERTVELIGEVAIRLQRDAGELDLPWREMAAMRNLLAHPGWTPRSCGGRPTWMWWTSSHVCRTNAASREPAPARGPARAGNHPTSPS